ncbi:HIT family protein [Streptomyces harbinensis]|uniref:Histidine triad (HIT) family protein n=1 Tax=Streptomyces harbinensis TaxID=1176198 RepID=A0A1I6WAP4_9ACTN|nr:HIT family protein [Streptomyces harbinensis]SFT23058.1 histidine triad (HIT) family protein [Streptomyces harbinensis]
MDPCPFCNIATGRAPAIIRAQWPDTIAIVPLRPVTPGHWLIIPRTHVTDATTSPDVTAQTMYRAAQLAADIEDPCNLITSVGPEATQSVLHLHIHLVPREYGDGLPLPWTPQQAAAELAGH